MAAVETMHQQSVHPYDNAYGMMKTMQAELAELRSALHAEQQQRTREVAELRREVIDLQARLGQQYAEQSMQHQTVSCALTNETALRGKSIEKLRSEVAEAIQRAEEVESLKQLQATQFGKLATELKQAKRERQAGHKDLDDRLRSEVSDRREQADKITEELANQKAVSEANLALDRERMDYLTQNVQMAGQLLSTGSVEGFATGNFASLGKSGGSMATAFSPSSTFTTTAPANSRVQSSGSPGCTPQPQTQPLAPATR
mmetsp:Transcript_115909/g.374513  ORF Transcript_115909/g.374513 Transcript_115909/m.374513 type:complete len:259 (+) Transcript_115909:92-868(+)